MIFGPTRLADATGAVLGHTMRLRGRVLKKGTVLDAAAIAALAAEGHHDVVAAVLARDDVAEDAAADRLATLLAGPGLVRSRAATGRVNLFADRAGLLTVHAACVDRLNALDESLTLATLPSYVTVAPREMLATVKIIPFAVPGRVLAVAETMLAQSPPLLALHPFQPLRVGLVLTELPGTKASVMEGAVEVTGARIAALSGVLLPAERVRHDAGAVADALGRLRRAGAQLLLIAGASAVIDRRDVGPAAIVRAGGAIEHFGMPVDPGNLICLGRIEGLPTLVLPGCARSPKLNGFDWVLWRIFAGQPVGAREVMGMGVGGLLKEIETRPLPREQAGASPAVARVGALVLAAGRSSRMAPRNKLLVEDAEGVAMVARTVDHILASSARPLIVVTGHQRERVAAALAGRDVTLAVAEDYASGLSASLRTGLGALPAGLDGVLICLGDMPLVGPAVLDRLISAFDPAAGRAIVVPTHQGHRGNPILWGSGFLPDMQALTGDAGARALLARHADRVIEVEVADDGVLRDFDTPESLDAARELATAK